MALRFERLPRRYAPRNDDYEGKSKRLCFLLLKTKCCLANHLLVHKY